MSVTVQIVFEQHTLLKKLNKRKQFYSVRMKNIEKLLTYLNHFKRLAAPLKSMQVDVKNKNIAKATLKRLSQTFKSIIVALDAFKKDSSLFTLEFDKFRLILQKQGAFER